MNALQNVKKPAAALIVLAVLNLLIWLRMFERLITPRGEWTTEHFLTGWMDVLFLGIPSLLQVGTLSPPPVLVSLKVGMLLSLFIFYGAAHMMAGKRYYLSYSCSVVSMIPILSPLFILGLPIGSWALYTLHQPDVKTMMTRD